MRPPLAFTALLLLAGCGGSSPGTPSATAHQARFDDPGLQALWVGAQNTIIAQGAVLNAALIAEANAAGQTPPDPVTVYPSAMLVQSITPDQVTVTVIPDPHGSIPCPANSGGVLHCASYTQGNAVFVAQSLEYSPSATGWEFQNIILAQLGYNTSGR